MQSKKRTDEELLALQEELSTSCRLTDGTVEFSFLACLAKGDCASMTELSEIIACQFYWLSCESDCDGLRATCWAVPEGEEMMACGRVSHPSPLQYLEYLE